MKPVRSANENEANRKEAVPNENQHFFASFRVSTAPHERPYIPTPSAIATDTTASKSQSVIELAQRLCEHNHLVFRGDDTISSWQQGYVSAPLFQSSS